MSGKRGAWYWGRGLGAVLLLVVVVVAAERRAALQGVGTDFQCSGRRDTTSPMDCPFTTRSPAHASSNTRPSRRKSSSRSASFH